MMGNAEYTFVFHCCLKIQSTSPPG